MKKSINNNIKNTITTNTANATNTNKPSNFKKVKNTKSMPNNNQNITNKVKPVIDTNIQTDKNYVILIWQNKNEGIVRKVMEVPGFALSSTLETIREQRRAFDFYMKR